MAKETKKTEKKDENVKEAKAFEYKESEAEITKPQEDEKYTKLYNQHLRLQADFDNYKKRNATLTTTMFNEGVNDVLTAILPTVDSLDRAIEAQKDDNQRKGIELVKKAYMDVLAKYNVVEIKALGEKFDPNIHEAVMSKEDPENSGKVVQVLRAGYMRGDKVLRHSMCVVAQ